MIFSKKLTRKNQPNEHKMYLVTGADSSHAKSLLQFIRSVTKHEQHTRLVVYDLGLTAEERNAIKKEVINGSVETFPYENFPPFFNMAEAAGRYAWKPAIIALEMTKSDSPICWMDAGNVLTGPLNVIRSDLAKHGFFSPESKGTVSDLTHPAMLEYLGLPVGWGSRLRNKNGACVAFNPAHPEAFEVAQQWTKLAHIKACIAPEGSDRTNHRQDQAVLSVLVHRSSLIHANSKCSGFLIHQDIE